jgi:hypothetical protein
MRTQYTVRNLRGGFGSDNVVIRTHDREVVLGWLDYSVTPKCHARIRYGLEQMERRAASAMQYGLFDSGEYLDA